MTMFYILAILQMANYDHGSLSQLHLPIEMGIYIVIVKDNASSLLLVKVPKNIIRLLYMRFSLP